MTLTPQMQRKLMKISRTTASQFSQEEKTMDNYHVSPTSNGWELKKAGADRASKRAVTKQE